MPLPPPLSRERKEQAPSFSRCGASEVLGTARGTKDAGRDRVTPKFSRPGGRTGFGSIKLGARPGLRSAIREANCEWRIANGVFSFVFYSLLAIRHSPKKQGRRNAGRRHPTNPHHRVRRAPCGARCAYRRSTAALVAANQRRHSAPVRASWDPTSAAVTPPSPIPVQRSNRRPVVMPAGRFPEAARERR